MSNVAEAKSLRWLVNNFPFIEHPKDDIDRMNNLIHLYCKAGADKIDELSEKLNNVK